MLGRVYPSWVERTTDETDDWSGTFIALLLKASYTFDATDIFISDLTVGTNELSGGGYARVNPTGLSTSRTGLVTTTTFSAITFPLVTATGADAAACMILARFGTGDSDSPLIVQQDFEGASDASNEDIVITPSANGFYRSTVSNPA